MTTETRLLVTAVVLALAAAWTFDRLEGLLLLLMAAGALRWSRDASRLP